MEREGALTLATATQAYLGELGLMGRSPRTIELHGWLLRKLVADLGPDCAIQKITRADISAYMAGLAERGLSQSYIALNAKVVLRFANWLTERGEIDHNPLQGMKIRMPPDKPIAPFTDEECYHLIDAASKPLQKAVLLLLMDTGLRAAELASLRLEDIDFQAGEIVVKGKGGKVRKLALNAQPQQALEAWLASRVQLDGLLWPSGWNRKSVGPLIDSIARKARVARCFPHRFRHNWGIRMTQAGVDALTLKQLMGHSSLRTTARYLLWVQQQHAVTIHKQHSIVPAA